MRAVPHGKEGKVEVIDRKTITAVIFWPHFEKCTLYGLICILYYNVEEKEKLLTAGQSQRMRKGRSGVRGKF